MDKKHFFWGIVLGVVISSAINFLWHLYRPPFHRFGHRSGFNLEEHFSKELELSSEQRERMSPEIKQFDERLKAARRAQFETVKSAMDDLDQKFQAVLSAEQMQKLKEMRERFEKFRLKGGRFHGHRGGRGQDNGHAPEPAPSAPPGS
jgi:gas vesicle protein